MRIKQQSRMYVSTHPVKAQSRYKKSTILQHTSVFLLSLVVEGIFEFLELNSDGSIAALCRGRPGLKVVNKGLNGIFCAFLGERRRCEGLDTKGRVQRSVHDQGKRGHVCKTQLVRDGCKVKSSSSCSVIVHSRDNGSWPVAHSSRSSSFRIPNSPSVSSLS